MWGRGERGQQGRRGRAGVGGSAGQGRLTARGGAQGLGAWPAPAGAALAAAVMRWASESSVVTAQTEGGAMKREGWGPVAALAAAAAAAAAPSQHTPSHPKPTQPKPSLIKRMTLM